MELRSGKRLKMLDVIPKQKNKTVLMLNDDCLYLIFEYLDIHELILAEKVCRRFKAVAEMIYPTWKILNFEEIVRRDWRRYSKLDFMSHIRKILRRVSPYVYKFKFRYAYIYAPDDVEELDLLDEIMKHTFRAVKEVDVETSEQITDEILMSMFRMDQVEVLNVPDTSVEGTFLAELKTIKEINLLYCRILDWELFDAFCVANPQLTKLHLNIDHRNLNYLQVIAKNLVNLECLYIPGHYAETEISSEVQYALANLPKLTGLGIREYNHYLSLDVLITKLLAMNRLEYLDISYSDISRFVDAITNLSHLKVLKMNKQEDSQVVLRILERISCGAALQELHIQRCKIPHLYLKQFIARHTSIRYIDMFMSYSFKTYQHIIPEIADLVKDRHHVLKIAVMKKKYFSNLKDIYDGRKGSFKLVFGSLY